MTGIFRSVAIRASAITFGAQLGDSDVLHGQKEAVLMVEQ
jgi:hypothetical protein